MTHCVMLLALLLAQGIPNQVVSPVGRPTTSAVNVQVDPAHPIKVDIGGTSVSATTTCHATSAAPTYVNGTDDPLSCDLAGTLRTSAGGGGGGGSVTQGTTPWAVSLMNSGTTGVVMLNAVSTTGASATYTNANGYTAHVLHVVATGTPNIVIRLEGSYDNSNWNILSTVTQASASLNDLVASGWYPYLRANLNTFSGGSSPTLTAVYHGIDASIASTQLPAALDANGNLKIHEQQTNPQLPANLSAGVNLRTTLQDWGTGGGSGGAAFTSGSALDSTSAVTSASIAYAAALVSVNVSGSITSGSLNVECSNDAGTTYFACVGARASSGAADTVIALNGVTKEIWRVPFAGLSGFRVRLNPVITGAGTATVAVALSAVPSSAVVSAQSLPLPAGASTEATLALIKAKTDNLDVALSTRTKPADTQAISAASLPLPTGAATDRTTAAGPVSTQLSDGAAFYAAAKTGQLPAALDGSGFLKTHEQGTATVTGTVTTTPPANASTNIAQVNAVTVQTGAGTAGTGTQRVAIATSDGIVPATANSGRLQVDVVTGGGSNASVVTDGAAPGASDTQIGASVTTAAPTYTTGQIKPLSLDTTGSLRVNVTAGGGSNASVVTDGAAPAASDTQIGGSVTTAAPTYTTGQVKPFSLDTTGSLRVNVTAGGGSNASVVTDGAAPPASDTMISGSVTTAAPTYTTGQSKPLSLQTDGSLRVSEEQANTGTAGSTLLSAVTVAGAGSALTNGTGNTSHAVIVTYTSTPTVVALNLEGSYNNSNWIVLASTNPTPATPSYLTACGWYPYLRANLVTLTGGTSPAVTAVYHGTNVASAVCDNPANTYSSNTVNATCADPGTGCAAGTFISIPTAGQMSFGFHNPTSSTLAGTLKAECSYDNGSTYNQNTAYFDAPGSTVASTVVLTSGVQYDATIMGCGGADRIRVRNVSATGSGAVTMNGTMITDPSVLFSGTSGSAVQPPRIVSNGVWDGTNLKPFSLGHGVVDADTQRVFLAQKATYQAVSTRTATAAGTGPFWNICGSASKTVRLQYLQLDIQIGTAAINSEVVLTKTSAATTAGTATTVTDIPADSNSAAGTATTKNYTVLGTAGTPVGKIDSASGLFPITASPRTTATVPIVFDYRNRQESESFTLRGVAQCVEASFAATTTNPPTIGWVAKWTEE